MDQITLQDYRCFHGEQTARLAPLTLLVGENSTGKTSFMAMLRALWEVAYGSAVPDFKEQPYDLGSFEEIAHHRSAGAAQVREFRAGFRQSWRRGGDVSFDVTFGKRGTVPVPIRRQLANDQVRLETLEDGPRIETIWATAEHCWRRKAEYMATSDSHLLPFHMLFSAVSREHYPGMDQEVANAVRRLRRSLMMFGPDRVRNVPFASAPVRSRPRRTYDPARATRDPEGDYVPMYLAQTFTQDKDGWEALKSGLEEFGKNAGLFDEITIKTLGRREGEPFQVRVRRFEGRRKGPSRNLVDVGYGVSQILPLITELLRPDAPSTFLLQQPEVHLHPSAQAALGSLFFTTANQRQLIVETHSDYIIDRVRMDLRDRKGPGALGPADVSILYFERDALGVRIHSLSIDRNGNIVGAPDSYGAFFMHETRRSIGL